jgi:hypothetical protein
LSLAFDVLRLGLDLKHVLALPDRLVFKVKELLGSLLILELDEDRALEELVVGAAETNSIGRTVWSKESFDVELRAGLLIAKTFDIDGSCLNL